VNGVMHDFHVEVRDQEIVVTMPGTSLRVVYRKPIGVSSSWRGSTTSKISEGVNHTRRVPD
jgi:hypothetical protein